MVSQILGGGDPAEVAQLAQLLDFVDSELLGSCNFEFLQVPVLQLGHAQCMEQRQLPAQCHCCQWLSCRNLQVGRTGRAEETDPSWLQAFLRAVLQIHGEAIMEHDELRRRAKQIEQHLRKSWSRIESLVEKTRCMVGLLSNQQI